jgi:ADP-ribose pyrophosphatase YjhB (NUDIX family)
MAAGALFVDADGRMMLVEPCYKPHWDIPGGMVEPGESPLSACRREVEEELGITPPIGRLLAVDWAPRTGEGGKILYVFDGGTLPAGLHERIVLQREELRSYRYVAAEEMEPMLIPRLFRRLRSALRARDEGSTLYLEHGVAPPQYE